jgi:hypothetical protein
MTTLRQIELSCPICSSGRAAVARQAARDVRRDTETIEVMYDLTSEAAADIRDAHDVSVALLTLQTSDRRGTRTRPDDNHSYSRCA